MWLGFGEARRAKVACDAGSEVGHAARSAHPSGFEDVSTAPILLKPCLHKHGCKTPCDPPRQNAQGSTHTSRTRPRFVNRPARARSAYLVQQQRRPIRLVVQRRHLDTKRPPNERVKVGRVHANGVGIDPRQLAGVVHYDPNGIAAHKATKLGLLVKWPQHPHHAIRRTER